MANLPNYLNPDNPSKRGRKREKKATQSINSGALSFDPRDIKVKETDENFLVDSKDVKEQKHFQFHIDDIHKFYQQAGTKTPVYLVYIGKYVLKCFIQKIPKVNY